jgi:hypothetical protein
MAVLILAVLGFSELSKAGAFSIPYSGRLVGDTGKPVE